MTQVFVDSFSGHAAELAPSRRTPNMVLAALATHPRVSSFALSQALWLVGCIDTLKSQGLLEDGPDEGYPWVSYRVTDAGRKKLKGGAT